jgi:hypothetical protein
MNTMPGFFKSIQWKTLIIGTIAGVVAIAVLSIASTLIADYILLKSHNRPFTFSILSGNESGLLGFTMNDHEDARFEMHYARFYEKWFPIISLILVTLALFLGGYVTGKMAKEKPAAHGIMVGTLNSIVFLTWLAPLGIAASWLGAALANKRGR